MKEPMFGAEFLTELPTKVQLRPTWYRRSGISSASTDIVDSNQTAVGPVVGAALFAAANLADVLVVIPHIIARDGTTGSLDKHSAKLYAIAVAISTGTTRSKR